MADVAHAELPLRQPAHRDDDPPSGKLVEEGARRVDLRGVEQRRAAADAFAAEARRAKLASSITTTPYPRSVPDAGARMSSTAWTVMPALVNQAPSACSLARRGRLPT